MTEDNIIDKALSILKERIRTPGVSISSPDDTIRYLTLKLAECEHEKFCAMFLDNREGCPSTSCPVRDRHKSPATVSSEC